MSSEETVQMGLILPMGNVFGLDWGIFDGAFGVMHNGVFVTASHLYHAAVSVGKFNAQLSAVAKAMRATNYKGDEYVEVALDV